VRDVPIFIVGAIHVGRKLGIRDCFFAPVGQGQVFAPAKPAYRTSMYITAHRNGKTVIPPQSPIHTSTAYVYKAQARQTHQCLDDEL